MVHIKKIEPKTSGYEFERSTIELTQCKILKQQPVNLLKCVNREFYADFGQFKFILKHTSILFMFFYDNFLRKIDAIGYTSGFNIWFGEKNNFTLLLSLQSFKFFF